MSSYQKNTVVGALPSCPRRPFGFPRICRAKTYHHYAGVDPCTEPDNLIPRFSTVDNQHPPYDELVMEKLYLKVNCHNMYIFINK